MKNYILSLCAVAAINATAFAQIPNPGFENWTTIGSYMIPDGWGTMNNTTAGAGVFTATKATPGSPGSAYIKLTSKTVSGFGVVNGIAVSGKLDSMTMQPVSGFAFNLRPANFTGKWQHMIYGSSQGSVKVLITRWNATTSIRDTVAHAEQTLTGMAMSWANFNLPLMYIDSLNYPDSCIIELRASGVNPTNNDYLWVDNLAFSGIVPILNPVGIKESAVTFNSVTVFPNPAREYIQLNLSSIYPQQLTITLSDISGRLLYSVKKESMAGEIKENIDVRHFPKGTYLLKISCKEGSETKKIVIE